MKRHYSFITLKLFAITLIMFQFSSKKINAQFAYGADVSWLSQMEYYGWIFKDNQGNERDCLDILKSKGINALRFRVWVNPAENFNNKKDVTYMAQRAKNKGFDIMINFHFSDYWADPGKQTKPAAWASHSFSQLLDDVYNHVYDILDTLKSVGITPKWVQIGNETNDGMLWEDGRASKNMDNFAALINRGYDAAKAIDNSIQVIIQLSNGYDYNLYQWMFLRLKNSGAKWDIVGMSAYPTYHPQTPSWSLFNTWVYNNMQSVATMFSTKVMICETGYPYNHPSEAKNFLADLIEKTKSVGGLGVFYWEPQCYSWKNYSLGAWDPITKQPTIALDAFLEANPVSVKENEIISDYKLEIYPNPFNSTTIISWQQPQSSYVSLKIYDSLGREVSTLINVYKMAGSHKLTWITNNLPSGIYFCRIISQQHTETKKIVLMK